MSDLFQLAMVLSVVDRATAPLRGVTQALSGTRRAADALKGAGTQMLTAGGMMQGGASQMVSGLKSIVAPAADIEEALAKVQTVVTPFEGTMTDALGRIKSAAIEHSLAHRDSAATFIETTYSMISAGLDEKQAVEGVSEALKVARATMGEGTVAASLLATVYNNMGDKTRNVTEEMTRLGGIITATQQTFQIADLAQLNEGMKFAMPVAKQFGIELAQASAVVGQLNTAGLAGGQAGTAFGATMRTMGKASKELGFEVARNATGGVDFLATLKAIEGKFGSLSDLSPELLQQFQALFGDEGFRGLSLMIGQSGKLESQLAKVRDSASNAADAQKIMESTWAGSMQIIDNNVIALKDTLAQQLMPTLKELGASAKGALDWFRGFAEAHPELVKTGGKVALVVAALLSIVSPILIVVGSITMFAGHAMTGFALVGTALKGLALGFLGAAKGALVLGAALFANPITWIVLAIVAAAALIYIYWEPIRNFFVGLWQSISSVFTAAINEVREIFKDGFLKGIRRILEDFNPVVWLAKGIGALVSWLVEVGPGILAAAADLGLRLLTGIVDTLLGLPSFLLELGAMAIGALISGVEAAWGGLLAFLGTVWTSITDAVRGGLFEDLAAIFNAINPVVWIADAFDALTQYLFGFSLYDAGANILRTVVSGIQSMASAPFEAVKSVMQRVRNLLPFSPAKEGPLRDLDRIRLIETVAQAVRPAPLVRAMSGAAAMAVAAMPAAMSVAPLPSGAGAGAGGSVGGAPITMHVQIHLGGGDKGAVQQLEEWLNNPSNAELLSRTLQQHQRRETGRSFA